MGRMVKLQEQMKSVTQTNCIKLVQSGLKAKHTILTH